MLKQSSITEVYASDGGPLVALWIVACTKELLLGWMGRRDQGSYLAERSSAAEAAEH
jgi:hypothetical protein